MSRWKRRRRNERSFPRRHCFCRCRRRRRRYRLLSLSIFLYFSRVFFSTLRFFAWYDLIFPLFLFRLKKKKTYRNKSSLSNTTLFHLAGPIIFYPFFLFRQRFCSLYLFSLHPIVSAKFRRFLKNFGRGRPFLTRRSFFPACRCRRRCQWERRARFRRKTFFLSFSRLL